MGKSRAAPAGANGEANVAPAGKSNGGKPVFTDASNRRRSLRSSGCANALKAAPVPPAPAAPRRSSRLSNDSAKESAMPRPKSMDRTLPAAATAVAKQPRRTRSSDVEMKDANIKNKRTRSLSNANEKRPTKKTRRQSSVGSLSMNENTDPYSLAFIMQDYAHGIAPHDLVNCGNVMECPELVTDIYQRLYQAEETYSVTPYMDRQTHITANMRTILVDWLVEVHKKFRICSDALFLTVNIIDRYLESKVVIRNHLQLVGITALLIACKYEEVYPPEVRDCVYITDRAYTRQEVLDTETDILNVLQFKISGPTAYPFLTRFLFLTGATATVRFAAHFYLERMLQEYESLSYRGSMLAAACVCLALNHSELRVRDQLDGPGPGVPQLLLDYTSFPMNEIVDVATLVAGKVAEVSAVSNKRQLDAVVQRYDCERFDFVSTAFAAPNASNLPHAS